MSNEKEIKAVTEVAEDKKEAEDNKEAKDTKEYIESIERPYTLRKLKDGDLFPFLQIIRKLGLKDFKEAFNQVVTGGVAVKDVGVAVLMDMADKMIENIGGPVGEEIYEFYANLSGITVDEIKEMEFGTLPMMIYDSVTGVKDTAFFKVLSRLL